MHLSAIILLPKNTRMEKSGLEKAVFSVPVPVPVDRISGVF